MVRLVTIGTMTGDDNQKVAREIDGGGRAELFMMAIGAGDRIVPLQFPRDMTKPLATLILFSILSSALYAEPGKEAEQYTAEVWKNSKGESLNYRHRAPDMVDPGKKYPLIVFYHGAGGRGDNNLGQIADAGAVHSFAKAGVFSKRGAYVIAGQVPKGKLWVDVSWSTLEHKMPKVSDSLRLMFEAVDAYVADRKNQIDPKRIYAMGLSMGGYGTWDAIQRRPKFFAAAVPICGGGDKSMGKALAPLPIWAWHGDKDNVIKPSRSTDMIAAIKAAGGSAKYSELPGVGHNAWSKCWASKELWDWLFAQKR